jgi:hypothetical protein
MRNRGDPDPNQKAECSSPMSPSPPVPILAYGVVAAAIQARHLQTELGSAAWVRPADAPSEAAANLAELDFDQAPVGRPQRVLGYVLTRELRDVDGGRIGRRYHRLDASVMLSGSAGIPDVIDLLRQKPMAFVVDGRRVTGFVTISDLNKHPARAHFYLLLADLEMSLASPTRERFIDQAVALEALGQTETKKVTNRYKRDQKANVAVDLVSGMDLGHLLVVAGSDRVLRADFRPRSRQSWDSWSEELTKLRNAVMHPVLSLLNRDRTPADLARIEREIHGILTRGAANHA